MGVYSSSYNTPWHYYLLWLVVIFSSILNIFLLVILSGFRADAQRVAADIQELLAATELSNIEVPIHVRETMPLSMTVPFSDTFTVPVETVIPISTTILFEDTFEAPINTTLPINTDVMVRVNIPGLGNTSFPIPIVANIPVDLIVEVPISREIPIQTDIEINMIIDAPVSSNIPIQTDVPVALDFPVIFSLEASGFDVLFNGFKDMLADWVGD